MQKSGGSQKRRMLQVVCVLMILSHVTKYISLSTIKLGVSGQLYLLIRCWFAGYSLRSRATLFQFEPNRRHIYMCFHNHTTAPGLGMLLKALGMIHKHYSPTGIHQEVVNPWPVCHSGHESPFCWHTSQIVPIKFCQVISMHTTAKEHISSTKTY